MTRAELLSLRLIAAQRKSSELSASALKFSLWCLAGFIFCKWGVRCLLFTGNISVGFIFNGWWAHSYPSHSFDWFFDWFLTSLTPFYVVFLFLFCLAILSWLEFAHFFSPCTFYLLIWHVVLMQNDKTGACECVCWIYFLKCKWFCVCVYLCECKREQFTVVIGYPPALWVHMFELALHSWFLLIGIWGMWIQFVWARKHTGTGGWSFLWFYSVVSFPRCCQHLCVYVMIGSSMSTH